MSKRRLEAFSDGVIAILITIMVLELRPPHGNELAELMPLLPTILSYMLSFGFLGIYWNNHHHLLHASVRVDGRILWANLHLLFWLSLIPFVTAWLGEHPLESLPTALYGVVLWLSGAAYYLLERALIARNGANSLVAQAVGLDHKGLLSLVFYTLAIGLAFVMPVAAYALYVVVAIMWFVPDQRIEQLLERNQDS